MKEKKKMKPSYWQPDQIQEVKGVKGQNKGKKFKKKRKENFLKKKKWITG